VNFAFNLAVAVFALIVVARARTIQQWCAKHLGDYPFGTPFDVWVLRLGGAFFALQLAYGAWLNRPH
jgi:hypothetical protein